MINAKFKLLLITILMLMITNCNVYRPSLDFEPEQKMVLFTFDDGPNDHLNTTREILKVLRKHNVMALFNLMGTNVDHFPDIARKIHEEGHIIANHQYTVFPVVFRSRKKIAWEMDSCTIALQGALGDTHFKPLYFRPSMGWINPRTKKLAKEREMKINGLTIYAFDTRKSAKNAEKIIEKIVKRVEKHNGGVIVLHDGIGSYTWYKRQVEKGRKSYDRMFLTTVTDSVITILRRKGFTFPELERDTLHDLSAEEKVFFNKSTR